LTRKRAALYFLGGAAALVLLAVAGGLLVLRSDWFYNQVHERIVSTVETATGGRVELGAFRFDWKRLTAEADGFVLHGSEPAGKPPLFRAASVVVGLKILSAWRREIDLASLDIRSPSIYLIVYPDGHTNIPEPKLKKRSEQSPLEALLNLTVKRFSVQNGILEIESQGRTPFDVNGRNLSARFLYELAGPRYLGDLSVQPLELKWSGSKAIPFGVRMAITLERNRIAFSSAQWSTGSSIVDFSGAIEDLVHPRGQARYQATATLSDVARILQIRGLERGIVRSTGTLLWTGGAAYSVDGDVHAWDVDFRHDEVRLRRFRTDGAVRVNATGAIATGLRFSGDSSVGDNSIPVAGRVSVVEARNSGLEFRGVSLALLGGSFTGEGALPAYRRFRVQGQIQGIEAKRAVAVYNRRQTLPWDSLVSGAITVDASFQQKDDLRVAASLTLSPALSGPPVRGRVEGSYDAGTGEIELKPSTLDLPASHVEVSGDVGRQMQARLSTRDFNDFLPVLGKTADAIPVKLQGGALMLDATVTGKPSNPQISGRVNLSRFSYSGELFDLLNSDFAASPREIRLQNATVSRGPLRAQFQAVLGLQNWKAQDDSAIAASATIRNAALKDVLTALHQRDMAIAGTLNLTGNVTGTVAHPQAAGNLELLKGSIYDEPFDRLTARASYTGRREEVTSGQIIAGAKQANFTGVFEHAEKNFESGRLQFQVRTNTIPLAQIHRLETERPGVQGSVQLTASGTLELAAGSVHIGALDADLNGFGLQLAGQPLGDANLTANTQGNVLRVDLNSDFADAMVQGQGEWRLEGNYPGSAKISFSRIDLLQLRHWVASTNSALPADLTGFAEGELRVDGPALEPRLLKAEVRLPRLEIGPLRNSGPVVATMANSVINIESARLTGRATDVSIGGRVLTQQKNPLELQINGKIDAGVLHDFNRDVTSSGEVTLEAAVRGPFSAPEVNGRLELQNVEANYADLPNGLTNARGVIAFTGNRATIQSFTGETGGGRIQLSGFLGYGGGSQVFRLHADARGVRVRYPPGVSTVANASLDLTGTEERSTIAGTITVLRTGFNLQSDLGSVLAQSAEPVRTPSARTGFLGGLSYDVTIQTSADTQVESSLTQGVQADANLRLRGTATNPSLLGRISVTQGQVLFFGSKYVINQGSISFFNTSKIEPVLDLALETRARGIDITLTVSGPLSRPTVTPRSDPPLRLDEIVALLATGRAPATDATQVGQQAAPAQTFQQSTASALLGQVITNPVTGRLQRFFGISKLRIDPTLPGVEYNPQARLTLEQQVTPEITFTYITNLTNANPQVVSVEWAVSRRWSVMAQREENGVFGLDFFFKRQFK
jgi:translocation and assembly module TamB